ncbi:MAG: beta-ketoacyl-ACP synthase II [Rhodoferax sp.]|nr:beta-ketoacyl-ACP synthase II [Actinomycetota bacterium]
MADTQNRRVVVTGLGATTPLGGDVPTTWQAVLDGTPGATPLAQDWAQLYGLPVTFAAQLAVPPIEVLAKVETRRLDPSAQYALIAAREAWADAGSPEVDGERLGVVVASGIGGVWTLLDQYDVLKEKGARRVFPLTVPMLMPNGPAAAVSLELGARGGVHTPVSACASGAEAIGYAAEMIRSGRADIVVAGGTEAAIHALPIAGFAAMQALSTRNEDPGGASRPYDTSRDGFVLGEGAGIVVLESEEHARSRGAHVYGEIAGCGITSDAHHIAAPDPVGAGAPRAIPPAPAEPDGAPSDVVHINAHATSTPVGDVAESASIIKALGSAADGVAVSATKSMTGHLLGAAGAVEAIFTVLALHHRLAPPTINLTDLDPDVHLDVVIDKPRALAGGDLLALNNSFGFGGHNVALAIRSAS